MLLNATKGLQLLPFLSDLGKTNKGGGGAKLPPPTHTHTHTHTHSHTQIMVNWVSLNKISTQC